MKPIHFKECNVSYAEDQPEYETIQALKLKDDCDTIITCWRLSFWERLKLLVTGRLWMALLMFNQPLTPSLLTVKKDELFMTAPSKKKTSWLLRLLYRHWTTSIVLGLILGSLILALIIYVSLLIVR